MAIHDLTTAVRELKNYRIYVDTHHTTAHANVQFVLRRQTNPLNYMAKADNMISSSTINSSPLWRGVSTVITRSLILCTLNNI
jgi:hypothetical protein